MNGKKAIMCPSARCSEGAFLLGVVQATGEVGILNEPVRIDAEFVRIASTSGRPPEKRFRFADKCLGKQCGQWSEHRCGVVENLSPLPSQDLASRPTPCFLASECRWLRQRPDVACLICPEVITER